MRFFCIILISMLSPSLFGQTADEVFLLKKWYYCDSAISPQQANIMYFSASEPICDPASFSYYWEFKEQNKYVWSDVIEYDDSPISNGVIVVSNDNWRLEGETVFFGELEFKIDVLNEKYLIIHRVLD